MRAKLLLITVDVIKDVLINKTLFRCLDKTKTGLISSHDIKRTLGMKGSGEPGTVQIT